MITPDRIPVTATLHLEVRSRGTPGKPKLEQRVYTAPLQADPADPAPCLLHMVREGETFGGAWRSTTTWYPDEVDLEAGTATYRQSLQASDKLVELLELFGWKRVS